MHFIKHHKFMKKKEEITDGLTVLRREGDLDQLARWGSGALIDGGAVDRRGTVDPRGMKGSTQEVSVCQGEGVDGGGGSGEAVQGGWHRRGRTTMLMVRKRGKDGY